MIDTNKPIEKLLVDITLSLIDEHKGLRGVTLREITRKAGCRHTNLYNYFDSFEDLLWACLAESINQNVEFTNNKMNGYQGIDEQLKKFAESQIDFALMHPGLYHFIWLESLNGTPPDSIKKVIHNPYEYFFEFLKGGISRGLSDKDIHEIADIIHGYMHGEICKLIKGRTFYNTDTNYRRHITENVYKIFSSLVNSK